MNNCVNIGNIVAKMFLKNNCKHFIPKCKEILCERWDDMVKENPKLGTCMQKI